MDRASFKYATGFSATFGDNIKAKNSYDAGRECQNTIFVVLMSAAQEVPLIGADAMVKLSRRNGTGTASASSPPSAISLHFSPIPAIASGPEYWQDVYID
jgi:hypothetical protein